MEGVLGDEGKRVHMAVREYHEDAGDHEEEAATEVRPNIVATTPAAPKPAVQYQMLPLRCATARLRIDVAPAPGRSRGQDVAPTDRARPQSSVAVEGCSRSAGPGALLRSPSSRHNQFSGSAPRHRS